MVLEKLSKALTNALRKLKRLPIIDLESIEEFIDDLRKALIESDVNVELATAITDSIREPATDHHLSEGVSRDKYIIKLLHDQLTYFLGQKPAPIRVEKGKENIVLLVGIQGSGKTTTIAKLAHYYKKRAFKVALVCTDTWRPGAYEQLKQLADRVEVPIYGDPDEKDALKLAKSGVRHFFEGKEKFDLILMDTAGRHKEERALMKEMAQIEKTIKPNETILVIDGTLGQQAFNQARVFAQTTSVGSIIVTKLDGTARGGGALSACAATGAKIKFIGTGENIENMELFRPSAFVGELLGKPDIEGILDEIEQADILVDEGMQARLMKGKLTLDDMLAQLRQLKKFSSLKKILSVFGGGAQLPPGINDIAKGQMKKWEIILHSMTSFEKENPKEIRGSRLRRIAIGAGVQTSDVKKLLAQFDTMNKFMKRMMKNKKMLSQVAQGGLPALGGAMGGMPGFPGGKPPKGFRG